MDIETCWYEFSPYLYIVAGLLAIYFSTALIGGLAGALLIVAALTILRLRWLHRRSEDKKIKRVG